MSQGCEENEIFASTCSPTAVFPLVRALVVAAPSALLRFPVGGFFVLRPTVVALLDEIGGAEGIAAPHIGVVVAIARTLAVVGVNAEVVLETGAAVAGPDALAGVTVGVVVAIAILLYLRGRIAEEM